MSGVFTDLTAAVMELTERQQNANLDIDLDLDPDSLFLITEVPDMDDLDDEEEHSYVVVYEDNNVAETPDLITRLRLLSLMSQEAINSVLSAMISSPDDEDEFVVVESSQRSQRSQL
jgi:hypothetical protein